MRLSPSSTMLPANMAERDRSYVTPPYDGGHRRVCDASAVISYTGRLLSGQRMENSAQERRWFWATLILSSISIIAVVFALWELVENRFFHDVDYVALHYLYISRGIASSLLLAIWAAWFVLRQRRRAEEELRRSRERYRGLLESSPGAVALFDSSLAVHEWNAAAERRNEAASR